MIGDRKQEDSDQLLAQIRKQFPAIDKAANKQAMIKQVRAACEKVANDQTKSQDLIKNILSAFLTQDITFSETSIALLFAMFPFYLKYASKDAIEKFRLQFNSLCNHSDEFLRIVLTEPIVIENFFELDISKIIEKPTGQNVEVPLHFNGLKREYLQRHIPHLSSYSGTNLEKKLTQYELLALEKHIEKKGDPGNRKMIINIENRMVMEHLKRLIAEDPGYLSQVEEIEVVYDLLEVESYKSLLLLFTNANIKNVTLKERATDTLESLILKVKDAREKYSSTQRGSSRDRIQLDKEKLERDLKAFEENQKKKNDIRDNLIGDIASTGIRAAIVMQAQAKTRAPDAKEIESKELNQQEQIDIAIEKNRQQFNKKELRKLYTLPEQQKLQAESIIADLPNKFGKVLDFSMLKNQQMINALVSLLARYPKKIIENVLHKHIDDLIFGRNLSQSILYPVCKDTFERFEESNSEIFEIQRDALNIISAEKWSEAIKTAESLLDIQSFKTSNVSEMKVAKPLFEGLVSIPNMHMLHDKTSKEFNEIVNIFLAIVFTADQSLDIVMSSILNMEFMKQIDVQSLLTEFNKRKSEIVTKIKDGKEIESIMGRIVALEKAIIFVTDNVNDKIRELTDELDQAADKELLNNEILHLKEQAIELASKLLGEKFSIDSFDGNEIVQKLQSARKQQEASRIEIDMAIKLDAASSTFFKILKQFNLDRIKAEKSANHPYKLAQTESPEDGFQTQQQQQHQVQFKQETEHKVLAKEQPDFFEEKNSELDKWLGSNQNNNRITKKLTIAAQQFLRDHAEYFQLGLQRDNLPQGLYIDTYDGEEYLNYNLELRFQRNKSPLTQVIQDKAIQSEEKLQEYTAIFTDPDMKHESEAALVSSLCDELKLVDDERTARQATHLMKTHSSEALELLANKIKRMPQPYQQTFIATLKSEKNWETYLTPEMARFMDSVALLKNPGEITWWNTLVLQHDPKKELNVPLPDLFKGFSYFVQQYKLITKKNDLPVKCELTNVENMLAGLDRYLGLLYFDKNSNPTDLGIDSYNTQYHIKANEPKPEATVPNKRIQPAEHKEQKEKKEQKPKTPEEREEIRAQHFAENMFETKEKQGFAEQQVKRIIDLSLNLSSPKNLSFVEDKKELKQSKEKIIVFKDESDQKPSLQLIKDKDCTAAYIVQKHKIYFITKDNVEKIYDAKDEKDGFDNPAIARKPEKHERAKKILDQRNVLFQQLQEKVGQGTKSASSRSMLIFDNIYQKMITSLTGHTAISAETEEELAEVKDVQQQELQESSTLSHQLKLIESYEKVFSWGSEATKTMHYLNNLYAAGSRQEDLEKIMISNIKPSPEFKDADNKLIPLEFPINAWDLWQIINQSKNDISELFSIGSHLPENYGDVLSSIKNKTYAKNADSKSSAGSPKYQISLLRPQKSVKDMSDEQLKTAVKLIKEKITDLTEEPDESKKEQLIQTKLYFLALIREALFRTDDPAKPRFPNATQILSVINETIINDGNSFAQIETGQGKSLTTALMAAMMWAEGRKVEICTSDPHLAQEGAQEFNNFFKFIDAVAPDSPGLAITDSDEEPNVELYKNNSIIYSDITNLGMFRSKMLVQKGKDFFKNKPISSILDEVDFIMDFQTTIRYVPKAEDAKQSENLSNLSQHSSIYFVINDFIDSPEFNDIPPDEMDKRKYLIEKAQKYIEQHAEPLEVKSAKKLIENSNQIDLWLQAAWKAKTLAENGEGDKFVIGKKTVDGVEYSAVHHIINQKINEDAQLMNGGQQFLHARLQKAQQGLIRSATIKDFVIEAERPALTSLTSKQFIDFYNNSGGTVKGITGTLGDTYKKQRARELFGADLTAMPLHQEKNREDEVSILKDDAAVNEKIMAQILTKHRSRPGCPILIICENPVAAKKMWNMIKQRDDLPRPMLYTATDKEPKELANDKLAIEAASQDAAIMITDSSLGRGKDFNPTHVDGLHVIVNYLGTDQEIKQAIGRSGRQGKKGSSYHMVTEAQLGTFYDAEAIREEEGNPAAQQKIMQQQIESARNAFAMLERRQKPFNDIYDNIQAYFQDQYIEQKANKHIDRVQYTVFKALLQSAWEKALRDNQSQYSPAEVETCLDVTVTAMAVEWFKLLKEEYSEEALKNLKEEIRKKSQLSSHFKNEKNVYLDARIENFDFIPQELFDQLKDKTKEEKEIKIQDLGDDVNADAKVTQPAQEVKIATQATTAVEAAAAMSEFLAKISDRINLSYAAAKISAEMKEFTARIHEGINVSHMGEYLFSVIKTIDPQFLLKQSGSKLMKLEDRGEFVAWLKDNIETNNQDLYQEMAKVVFDDRMNTSVMGSMVKHLIYQQIAKKNHMLDNALIEQQVAEVISIFERELAPKKDDVSYPAKYRDNFFELLFDLSAIVVTKEDSFNVISQQDTNKKYLLENTKLAGALAKLQNSIRSAPTDGIVFQRKKQIQELNSTETSFFAQLKMLNVQLTSIKDFCEKNIYEGELQILDECIECYNKIMTISESLIRNPEEMDDDYMDRVCKVFADKQDVLIKLYSQALIINPKLNQFVNMLKEKYNPSFSTLLSQLKEASKGGSSASTGISDLAITTVQRLPRYGLLLKEINNSTNKIHTSKVQIEKAFQDITATASYTNENLRQFEKEEKGRNLDRAISPLIRKINEYIARKQGELKDEKTTAKRRLELQGKIKNAIYAVTMINSNKDAISEQEVKKYNAGFTGKEKTSLLLNNLLILNANKYYSKDNPGEVTLQIAIASYIKNKKMSTAQGEEFHANVIKMLRDIFVERNPNSALIPDATFTRSAHIYLIDRLLKQPTVDIDFNQCKLAMIKLIDNQVSVEKVIKQAAEQYANAAKIHPLKVLDEINTLLDNFCKETRAPVPDFAYEYLFVLLDVVDGQPVNKIDFAQCKKDMQAIMDKHAAEERRADLPDDKLVVTPKPNNAGEIQEKPERPQDVDAESKERETKSEFKKPELVSEKKESIVKDYLHPLLGILRQIKELQEINFEDIEKIRSKEESKRTGKEKEIYRRFILLADSLAMKSSKNLGKLQHGIIKLIAKKDNITPSAATEKFGSDLLIPFYINLLRDSLKQQEIELLNKIIGSTLPSITHGDGAGQFTFTTFYFVLSNIKPEQAEEKQVSKEQFVKNASECITMWNDFIPKLNDQEREKLLAELSPDEVATIKANGDSFEISLNKIAPKVAVEQISRYTSIFAKKKLLSNKTVDENEKLRKLSEQLEELAASIDSAKQNEEDPNEPEARKLANFYLTELADIENRILKNLSEYKSSIKMEDQRRLILRQVQDDFDWIEEITGGLIDLRENENIKLAMADAGLNLNSDKDVSFVLSYDSSPQIEEGYFPPGDMLTIESTLDDDHPKSTMELNESKQEAKEDGDELMLEDNDDSEVIERENSSVEAPDVKETKAPEPIESLEKPRQIPTALASVVTKLPQNLNPLLIILSRIDAINSEVRDEFKKIKALKLEKDQEEERIVERSLQYYPQIIQVARDFSALITEVTSIVTNKFGISASEITFDNFNFLVCYSKFLEGSLSTKYAKSLRESFKLLHAIIETNASKDTIHDTGKYLADLESLVVIQIEKSIASNPKDKNDAILENYAKHYFSEITTIEARIKRNLNNLINGRVLSPSVVVEKIDSDFALIKKITAGTVDLTKDPQIIKLLQKAKNVTKLSFKFSSEAPQIQPVFDSKASPSAAELRTPKLKDEKQRPRYRVDKPVSADFEADQPSKADSSASEPESEAVVIHPASPKVIHEDKEKPQAALPPEEVLGQLSSLEKAKIAYAEAEKKTAAGIKALYDKYQSTGEYDAQGVKVIKIAAKDLQVESEHFQNALENGVTLFFYKKGVPQNNPSIFYMLQQKIQSLYAAADAKYPDDMDEALKNKVKEIMEQVKSLAPSEQRERIQKLTKQAMEEFIRSTLLELHAKYTGDTNYDDYVEGILKKSQHARSNTSGIITFNETTQLFSYDEGSNVPAHDRGYDKGVANLSWTCDGNYHSNNFQVTSSLVKHASLPPIDLIKFKDAINDNNKFDIFIKTYENLLEVIRKQAAILLHGGAKADPLVIDFNYSLLTTNVLNLHGQHQAYLYIKRAIQALDGATLTENINGESTPITVRASVMNLGMNLESKLTTGLPIFSSNDTRERENRKAYARLSEAVDFELAKLGRGDNIGIAQWLKEKAELPRKLRSFKKSTRYAENQNQMINQVNKLNKLYYQYAQIKQQHGDQEKLPVIQRDIEISRRIIKIINHQMDSFEKKREDKEQAIWKAHQAKVLHRVEVIKSHSDGLWKDKSPQELLPYTILALKAYLDKMYYSGSYKSDPEKAALFHTYQLALERLIGMSRSVGCKSANDRTYLIRVMQSVFAAKAIPADMASIPAARAAFKQEFSAQSMTHAALHSCIVDTSGGTPKIDSVVLGHTLLDDTNIGKMKEFGKFAPHKMLEKLDSWVKRKKPEMKKAPEEQKESASAATKQPSFLKRFLSSFSRTKPPLDLPPLEPVVEEISAAEQPDSRRPTPSPSRRSSVDPADDKTAEHDAASSPSSPAGSRRRSVGDLLGGMDYKHTPPPLSQDMGIDAVEPDLSRRSSLADAKLPKPPASPAASELESPLPVSSNRFFSSSSSSIASRLSNNYAPKEISTARQEEIKAGSVWRQLLPADVKVESITGDKLIEMKNKPNSYVDHAKKGQSVLNIIQPTADPNKLYGFVEQVTQNNTFKVVPILSETKHEEELEKLAFEMIKAFVDRRPGVPIRILPGNNEALVACYILICKANDFAYKNESVYHSSTELSPELTARLSGIKAKAQYKVPQVTIPTNPGEVDQMLEKIHRSKPMSLSVLDGDARRRLEVDRDQLVRLIAAMSRGKPPSQDHSQIHKMQSAIEAINHKLGMQSESYQAGPSDHKSHLRRPSRS